MKCYLCRSLVAPFITKNGFTIYSCSFCGLKQTYLGKDYEAFVREHYSKGYYTGEMEYGAYADYVADQWFTKKNMAKLLEKVHQYKSEGRLLDVGCAMGYMVELAIQQGFDAYGFDPSEYAVEHASNNIKGRIKLGTIDKVRYQPNTFDVITMLDVVEHLSDPIKDIGKLSTFLKDDGIFLIATGDSNSLAARILKRRWTFYIPPQHLYFFNTKTFETVLNKAGLKPVLWFKVGKWLSTRYVCHLARTSGESRIGNVIYNLASNTFFGSLPLYLALRDNMVVVAKKKIL